MSIEVKGVTKSFGSFVAVNDVSVTVPTTGPQTLPVPPITVKTTRRTMGSRPKSLEWSTWWEWAKKAPASPAMKLPSTNAVSL